MDLLSKIENTKRELEEFKTKQGTEGNPGEGDNPPVEDPTLANIRKNLEGDPGTVIPEAEPVTEPIKKEVTEADKHKFDVLQEKYNKEVPRLHSENKELREEVKTLKSTVEELRGLIKDLKAEKPPVKEPEPHKATKYSKLNLEDFADYDDGIQKIISSLNGVIEEADALKQENTRLKSENDAFKQEFTTVKDTATRVSETVLRNSERTFWGDVRESVPKFDEYNGDNGANPDPRWANYLAGFDKTGEQLRIKASKAIQSGDSKTLISIVKDFETLVIGESGQNEDTGKGKKPSLDDTISPDRGAGGAKGPGAGPGKIVTEKEIIYAEKMMKSGKLSTGDFNKLLDKYKKQLITGQGR